MGLRFKKSFNLGAGFKINLSKSGIGYSWGIPGFRKTKLCNGRTRTTFNIPGTGISYIKEMRKKKSSDLENNFSKEPFYKRTEILKGIEMEENNHKIEYDIDEINQKISSAYKKVSNRFILNLVILFVVIPVLNGLLGSFLSKDLTNGISLLTIVILLIKNNIRPKLNIDYKLNEECQKFYDDIIYALKILDSSGRVWYGERKIGLKKKTPSFIKSNIDAYFLNLGNIKFYFLPDRIIRLSGRKISFFWYTDFKYRMYYIDIAERKANDATAVREQWKYETKDGKRDFRYHNNFCKIIYRYPEITVTDDINKPLIFGFSNINNVKNFIDRLNYIKYEYNISTIRQAIKPIIEVSKEDHKDYQENITNHIKDTHNYTKAYPKGDKTSDISQNKQNTNHQNMSSKNSNQLKNEIEFYIFYDGSVRYMKIKQYSDFKAELLEFSKDGTFVEIKNKTMPILGSFLNQHISKKPANTRHAVDLFIKFIKTAEGKEALEKWNHIKTNG